MATVGGAWTITSIDEFLRAPSQLDKESGRQILCFVKVADDHYPARLSRLFLLPLQDHPHKAVHQSVGAVEGVKACLLVRRRGIRQTQIDWSNVVPTGDQSRMQFEKVLLDQRRFARADQLEVGRLRQIRDARPNSAPFEIRIHVEDALRVACRLESLTAASIAEART